MIHEIKTIYPSHLYVAYILTEEEYNSVFNDGKYNEIKDLHESGNDGLTINGKDKYGTHSIIISLAEDFETGTIIHECYHASNIIWDYIEAKHDTNNDEPFAYLLTYIHKEILEFINKIKDGNKN